MQNLNKTFNRQVSQMQQRIQDLLEHDRRTDPNENRDLERLRFESSSFDTLQDPNLIENLALALPESFEDRAVFIFSRLALFFDAGFFVEKVEASWEPQAFFHMGRVRACSQVQKSRQCHLPKISANEVVKLKTAALLKRLNFGQLDEENRLTTLLFCPSEDFAYILLSRLPDLWLKDHAERVSAIINKGLQFE